MQHVWKIYVAAWISTAIATCVGTYFTQSAWCMWVLVLPCFLSYKNDGKEEKM